MSQSANLVSHQSFTAFTYPTSHIFLDAGLIFSGKKSGTCIRGYDAPSLYTPAVNSGYAFHVSSRDIIVWFLMNEPEALYLYGPTGCGKTSLIKQLAARLNYPVFEVTGHERLEFPDLLGHLSLKNGNMHFENGPLTLAVRHGGLFLFNEIDLCAPATLAGLNTLLDGSPLIIAENGGELVTPHPMFRIAVTANTNGGSDESGLYQGVLRQNLAFLDRFMMVEVDYPIAQVEIKLLQKHCPILPQDTCAKMVEFAGEVRRLFTAEPGSIEVTLSTRTLIRWADLTVRFQALARQGIQPLGYALDRALGFRASPESRAMLHELVQRIFLHQEDMPRQNSAKLKEKT